MTHELQRLKARHYKILEMVLAGHNQIDIANTLDVTRENVGAVVRSPLFQGELNRRMIEQTESSLADDREAFESRAKSVLEESSEKAANTQVNLLDSKDDSVRLRASGSILDRVLGKPDTKLGGDSASPTVNISAESAQLLVLTLKEIHPHAQEPITNGETAEGSENQQGNVHQTPSVGSGVGHRASETQDRSEEIKTADGP